MRSNVEEALKELQKAPGIGPALARDLVDIGIKSLGDLKMSDPERLYLKLSARRRRHIDRCVLYAFRCAVYFASTKRRAPGLLKWWVWKDADKKTADKKGDRG